MNTLTRKTGLPAQPAQARGTTADGGRKNASPTSPSSPNAVAPDRIRGRAYEIYRGRTGSDRPGDEKSDWLQAERELSVLAPDPSAAADVEIRAQARGERLLATSK